MQGNVLNRVLIVGAGTMGRQVALQCAMHGYEVALYDIAPEVLEAAMKQIDSFATELTAEGRLTESEATAALGRISTTNDPGKAAEGADLLSESVPENPKLKGQVLGQFNALCPSHTIFTTNTSSLLPSQFASASGRPGQFCALHFHQPVWSSNVVDIMPHPGTSAETVALIHDFAQSIDQIPIILKQESAGYVFNAMLDAVLSAALRLVADEVATVEDIDRAWMGISQMPIGPFGILDLVGIDLAYEITAQKSKWVSFLPQVRRVRQLLEAKVDGGKLGMKSGEGFYTYPNPAFQQPGFVAGKVTDLKRE